MALFVLRCMDRPGALDVRLANRAAHLAYLRGLGARLFLAGPLLDAQGDPKGSLVIVDVADQAEARALAEGDPYAAAQVFELVEITPYRKVLPDA